MPNIKNLTNKIINCFKEENVKIAQYNVKSVKSLYSKLKDQTPKMVQSNVIYKVECKDCNGKYVGQTTQWLKNRISLHKSDIRKENQRCALAKHSIERKHEFDFDQVEILDKHANYNKRLILEMVHINKETDVVNKKSDTQNLSNIYTYLLTCPNREPYYEGPRDE